MDLIYMDSQRKDVGVLQRFELDLAFGVDENNFECAVSRDDHCCNPGFYFYIEGTEYGGIIDGIESKNTTQEVVYTGRTWHGILDSKILEPDPGADYLICNGEANAVLGSLISRISFTDLFAASSDNSGLTISNYKMNRYISGYEGITKMLKSVGGKLLLRVQDDGRVLLSAAKIKDYSDDELDTDQQIDLDVKQVKNKVNHLICLGQGELANRTVIHLYADASGNVSQTQTFSGMDEYVATFDYSNAEDEAELIKAGTERLQDLQQQDSLAVDVSDDIADLYDVGDMVGAYDNITNIRIAVPVKKKIVTIKNGIVSIAIKTDTSGSTTISAGSSGGGGGGSSGGTLDHTQLNNRDVAGQHPMSAITDLDGTLKEKLNAGNALTNTEIETLLGGV
jgi:hypothetical protein